MSATWSPATHQRHDTRERFAFTKIAIDRAPGIHPGFAISDLSPDINIIFGPNASGKSTTARAIQSLIWPHPHMLRGHQLRGEFNLGEEHWEIEADATRVACAQDGQTQVPPVLTPIDDRLRYTLGLHDLLSSENQPFAQAILRESSGGFDLDAVAEAAGYRENVPRRLESERTVESSLNRVRDAERIEGEVVVQAGQLVTLRKRERAARQAQADAEAIHKALHLARVRYDLEQARQELDAFPPELARITGEEPGGVDALNERIAELGIRRNELLRNRDRAVADRDATNLDDQAINEGVLHALRVRRDEIHRLNIEIASVERDLESAKAERQSNQRRLAADLSDEQIASLDADGIRELAELAHAYEEIRLRRRARDEVEQWIGGVTRPQNVDTLRAAIDALSRRVQTPNRKEAAALMNRARMAAYVGGIFVIAVALWLAAFVASPWIVLAIPGLLVILFAWRFAFPQSVKSAELWEVTYRGFHLPPPKSWTIPAIRERIIELEHELRIALVEQEKAERWAALEQERIQLDRAYAETEERRNRALAQYGVSPDLKEESLRLLAENLGRWQAADSAVQASEALLHRVVSERSGAEDGLRKELGTYGYQTPEWDEHIEHLQQRYRALQDAMARIDAETRELEHALEPEIERYRQARADIFRQLGLGDGDEAALRALVAQLPAYRQAQATIGEREAAVRDAYAALSLTPELRDLDPGELQRRLEEAESAAAALDDVLREIGAIQTRIADAQHRLDIELALGRRDDAMNALRRDREEIATAIVGQLLITHIQHETRDAAMPIVFHRARELFAIITRGRYELELEEGPPPSFTALETSTGTELHLDQLSSGTRVQLLMAIRLAFVENVEVGPKLPVLLDETLGNSDELRASAIIDAAIEICRKGRQVFYFTAQGDEVGRWQARLGQIPSDERPASTIVDLADLRRDAGFDRLPMLAPQREQTPRKVTPPDGFDRDTYGSIIKAPRFDPWMHGSGGIHLWHLIDDLSSLHTLLQEDIQTWGQLAGLVRSAGIEGLTRLGVDEKTLDSAAARVRLFETAVAMWRIGHAHPVSLSAIAESGVVDYDALDHLGGMINEVGHDGSALIEALHTSEDPPISVQTIDRLETWLIREGYIAQGEPMREPEIRSRLVLSAREDLRRGHLTDADIHETLRQLLQ